MNLRHATGFKRTMSNLTIVCVGVCRNVSPSRMISRSCLLRPVILTLAALVDFPPMGGGPKNSQLRSVLEDFSRHVGIFKSGGVQEGWIK